MDLDASYRVQYHKEKSIIYLHIYVKFRKMVSVILFQSTNRDTDVERKHIDTKVEVGGGVNWEIGIDIYILLILCIK